MINIETFGHEKLIKIIKNEDYRRMVDRNGYCVGLLDIEELGAPPSYYYNRNGIAKTIKLTECLGGYKHTWNGELIVTKWKTRKDGIIITFKINKSFKLDKHALKGEKIKYLDIHLSLENNKVSMDRYASFKNLLNGLHCGDIEFCKRIRYINDTKKTGGLTWYKLYQDQDHRSDSLPQEFWIRIDMENNRGEIYLYLSNGLEAKINLLST
ncbi:hypothetical protein [Clostridium sp.]|uniref:hypothetical protein n=1 Tax=Clostridium sp. TaxID=1506 RepID=UPI001A6104EC|nr:hypothetical protein [Clostridium sp.]MBK5240242.1 hypothetical protein [Clostridium sp.]